MRNGLNVIIPWQQLDPLVLHSMLEEIVTRDGTDYGAIEKTTEEKVGRALLELKAGRAALSWDADSASGNLVRTDIREA